jgi:cyanophycinase
VIKKAEAASDPFVVDRVRKAEAIFIAGGDQWDYMRLWQGTPLQQAMQEVAQRAPFGGTSAGLAVLGQWVYTAQRGSVTSDQALANPYHRFLTLAPGLFNINALQGVITDSHFTQRDRMGRLVTFLARIVEDAWAPQATGIGVDEATAVTLLPNGDAQVMGTGRAFAIRTTVAPERCDPGVPLTIRQVNGIRAPSGSTFSLNTLSGTGVTPISVQAINGVVTIN